MATIDEKIEAVQYLTKLLRYGYDHCSERNEEMEKAADLLAEWHKRYTSQRERELLIKFNDETIWRNLDINEVYTMSAEILGVDESKLRDEYGHLQLGQQHLVLRSRIDRFRANLLR